MTWFEELPAGLPEGRLVTPYNSTIPVYWLSAEPARPGVWEAWHSRHPETGLWPVLVLNGRGDDPFEVDAEYGGITTIEQHNAAEVLAQLWPIDSPSDAGNYLEPVGAQWPGICAPLPELGPPVQFARQYAAVIEAEQAQLALIPAQDGAHAMTALRWSGPLNHENDTARLAAVVASWQKRFSATVVGLGFDTLHLSVAAPPRTSEEAIRVTAEHFAFCPDNIWQSDLTSFPEYAEAITGSHFWSFWWD